MTPDESAWWQALIEVLGCSPDTTVLDATYCADGALAELRKRREAGAFGSQVYENEWGNLDVSAPMALLKETLGALKTVMWHRDGKQQVCGACGYYRGTEAKTHAEFCPECCVETALAKAKATGYEP